MFSWLKKLFTRKPAKMPTYGVYVPPVKVAEKYLAYRKSMGEFQHTIWHMPPPLPTWAYAKSRVRDVLADVAECFEYEPDYLNIDDWRIPGIDIDGLVRGDRDAFAGLVKQRLLVAGFHESWLRLATCWTNYAEPEPVKGALFKARPSDYYHMCLIVTCTDRDMVLDNRYPQDAWAWASLGYRWHYREDGRGGFELLATE